MEGSCNLPLVLHGSVILLLGQFAGYAFFRALNASPDGARAGMWRMSHAACSTGAILLIAMAPVLPHLRLARFPTTLVVDTTVVSTYALCVGTVVAGLSGQRGLQPRGSVSNRVVYMLYIVGALGSTISALAFFFAALHAYLAP
jgi:hypothetical protein